MVFGSMVGLIVGNGPIVFFTFGLVPRCRSRGNSGGIARPFPRRCSSATRSRPSLIRSLAAPSTGSAMRRVSLTSIVLFALSIAALSQTPPSSAVFIAMAGLCGLCSAGQAPLPYAKAVSSWFDERRGLALGIAMTGIGIGATLVPQFARAVIAAYGWRTGYVALGALMLVVAFPAVAIFIREPDARHPGAHLRRRRRAGSHGWRIAANVELLAAGHSRLPGRHHHQWHRRPPRAAAHGPRPRAPAGDGHVVGRRTVDDRRAGSCPGICWTGTSRRSSPPCCSCCRSSASASWRWEPAGSVRCLRP